MIWIILVILGIVYFILDSVFDWDVWDEVLKWTCFILAIIILVIVLLCMFSELNSKPKLDVILYNIELEKDLVNSIKERSFSLNKSNAINIENNNFMIKQIEIEQALLKSIIKYNTFITWYKFMSNNKWMFIGFNQEYNKYKLLTLTGDLK